MGGSSSSESEYIDPGEETIPGVIALKIFF